MAFRNSVYFRKGKNGGRWYLNFADQYGQRRREATHIHAARETKVDREAAERLLAARLTQVNEGRYFKPVRTNTMTFGQWADEYIERKRVQGKIRDIDHHARRLKPLTEYFGGRPLASIAVEDVERYKAMRLATTSRLGRLLSPSTVNRELAVLRNMFSVAHKTRLPNGERLVRYNPVKEADGIFSPEPEPRAVTLSDDDLARLHAECPVWLKPIVKLAYTSGMRRGEILNLRRSQVDLGEGVIRLEGSDTKTQSGRVVPLWIFPGLLENLRDVPPALHTDRFFTRHGRAIRSIREAYTAAAARAGLDGVRFHDLRHVAITRMRRAGIDVRVRMALVGHKTLRIHDGYDTVGETDYRDAARLLATAGA